VEYQTQAKCIYLVVIFSITHISKPHIFSRLSRPYTLQSERERPSEVAGHISTHQLVEKTLLIASEWEPTFQKLSRKLVERFHVEDNTHTCSPHITLLVSLTPAVSLCLSLFIPLPKIALNTAYTTRLIYLRHHSTIAAVL